MPDKDFADAFYTTNAWRKCREAYKKYRQGLCERCMSKGLIVPAVEVHHKVRLTQENINNTDVTLNFDNLEALCQACHHDEHNSRRWRVDTDGHVLL